MTQPADQTPKVYSSGIKKILDMLPESIPTDLSEKMAYHIRDLSTVLVEIGTDLADPGAFKYVLAVSFANFLKGLKDRRAAYMFLFTTCKLMLGKYSELSHYAADTDVDVLTLITPDHNEPEDTSQN